MVMYSKSQRYFTMLVAVLWDFCGCIVFALYDPADGVGTLGRSNR